MEREEASKSKYGVGREEEACKSEEDIQTNLEIHLVQGSGSNPIQFSLQFDLVGVFVPVILLMVFIRKWNGGDKIFWFIDYLGFSGYQDSTK